MSENIKLTRWVATIAGLIGFVLSVATPLLPVVQTTATLNWPQNGQLNDVTAPLISETPVSMTATVPCDVIRSMPPGGGMVLGTAPKGGDWAGLADDSPWVTGPWVTELGEGTRHALASLDPASIPAVAAEWAAAEEFEGELAPPAAEQIIGELQGLARRAEEAGERLYCWSCLRVRP